jgi:hypothetical protein
VMTDSSSWRQPSLQVHSILVPTPFDKKHPLSARGLALLGQPTSSTDISFVTTFCDLSNDGMIEVLLNTLQERI